MAIGGPWGGSEVVEALDYEKGKGDGEATRERER